MSAYQPGDPLPIWREEAGWQRIALPIVGTVLAIMLAFGFSLLLYHTWPERAPEPPPAMDRG